MVTPARFDVYLVNLDPTIGSEIKKTRPVVIISPDEMNAHLSTVIVAPLTTSKRPWPTRINLTFQGKSGQIVLDQLRTVDKSRLVNKLGTLQPTTAQSGCTVLEELFAR
jgi:mRNA interferase MazF